jgi:sulfite exporter TauE/SafE
MMLLASVLGASLLGSLHCGAMCGPITGFVGATLNRKKRLTGQAVYHVARLLAYLALGALAGALGLGIDRAGTTRGIQNAAALTAALVMIAWALTTWLPVGRWLPWVKQRLPRLGCGFSRTLHFASSLPPLARAAVLGLGTGLLPCGWLYAFVAAAVGTGSFGSGALVLLAFWLGTLPTLLGIGSLARFIGARLRRHLPALSAGLVLGIGLLGLWSRHSLPEAVIHPDRVGATAVDGEQNSPAVPSAPPCHAHRKSTP